jgi:WD40 repeat protein
MVRAMAFSPDGGALVSAHMNGEVSVWDAASRARIAGRVVGSGKPIGVLAVSPDSRLLLVGATDGAAAVVRLPGLEPVLNLDMGPLGKAVGNVMSGAWSPDSTRVSVGTGVEKLGIWRVVARENAGAAARASPPEMVVFVEDAQASLAFAPDGERLLVGGDKRIQVLNARTGAIERELVGQAQGELGLAFVGRHLLVSVNRDRTIRLWEWPSGLLLLSLESPGTRQPGGLAVSSDGRWAACMVDRGGVVAWELPYYRRHVAGNAGWCLRGLDPHMGESAREGLIEDLERAAKTTGLQ